MTTNTMIPYSGRATSFKGAQMKSLITDIREMISGALAGAKFVKRLQQAKRGAIDGRQLSPWEQMWIKHVNEMATR